mmetsp:Transcript_162/g.507  ORF Transcript_162/g.507 Transcript_162/m.507 type:complete len:97 (-) Transcript_162:243-533(-)
MLAFIACTIRAASVASSRAHSMRGRAWRVLPRAVLVVQLVVCRPSEWPCSLGGMGMTRFVSDACAWAAGALYLDEMAIGSCVGGRVCRGALVACAW